MGLNQSTNNSKTNNSKGKEGVSSKTHTASQLNDYANQYNPNSSAYKSRMDNHANQLNSKPYASTSSNKK